MAMTDDRDSLFLRRTPPSAPLEDVVAPLEAAAAGPAGLYVDPADRPALVASRPRRWVAPIVVAVAIVVTYAGWRALQPPPSPPPVVAAPEPTPPKPAPEVAQQPAVKYPLPDALSGAKTDVSLPSLADSDAVLSAAIVAMASNTTLRNLLQKTDVARRIVATIDNLPRTKVPWKLLPVAPPSGAFVVAGDAAHTTIDARNGARYAPYMLIVAAVDPKELASVYGAYYPLLQEQYRALGYPAGNFNDRVIEAIDDMLAAPVPSAPPALTQPKVLYEFADAALEARSPGQKMMLRLGAADAARVKAKLRAIRKELAAAGPPESEAQAK
jgi:hypothetical protein